MKRYTVRLLEEGRKKYYYILDNDTFQLVLLPMYRHYYCVKLAEMHLDDWTIAKLLGHRGVHSVMHYRKMNNLVLAKETRKAREAQTRLLLANLDGWGEDYEQIRQDE